MQPVRCTISSCAELSVAKYFADSATGQIQKPCNGTQFDMLLAVRELGESMAAIARQFNISTVAVSKAVKRGAAIAKKEGLKLI